MPFDQTLDYKYRGDHNRSPQPEKLDQISRSTSNEVIHTAKRTEKNESAEGQSRDLNPNIQVVQLMAGKKNFESNTNLNQSSMLEDFRMVNKANYHHASNVQNGQTIS